jgi:stage V sporulation protein G
MTQQGIAHQTKIEARITPFVSDDAPHLRGLGSLTINDEIAVHNIRIIEGKNGFFASMPSVKGSDGEYHDTFFPVTKEAREAINAAAVQAYENAIDGTRATDEGNRGVSESYVNTRAGMSVSVKENSYGEGNIKAFASVKLDNAFVINGVKVVGSIKGPFVQMPNAKDKNGELKRDENGDVRSVVHPITAEAREKMITVVMNRFNEIDKDIGNVKYNDIKHPTHLSIRAEDLDKAVTTLNNSEIPYHGKISADGNLAITFNNNDRAAIQAVIKCSGVELAEKEKPTTQDLENFQQQTGKEMNYQQREAPARSDDAR